MDQFATSLRPHQLQLNECTVQLSRDGSKGAASGGKRRKRPVVGDCLRRFVAIKIDWRRRRVSGKIEAGDRTWSDYLTASLSKGSLPELNN